VWTNATLQVWGVSTPQAKPVITPDPLKNASVPRIGSANAAFDAIKQSYLLGATSRLQSAAEVEGLDYSQQRRLQFYVRQFVDAISPTNSLFTNPQVIHETMRVAARTWSTVLSISCVIWRRARSR
jgi:polyhydroxyalkanoate synthase